ncbi:MAG: hypothetical protein ACRD4B_05185, partial [Acidobacteriota bacterium]
MSNDDAQKIIEHFDNKFGVMLENVETIIDRKVRSIVREELNHELEPIKSDIKVIKAAVADTSHQVNGHEKRLTRPES